MNSSDCAAHRKTVAILLFTDIEVLDFAGPFEVFAVTDELSDYKFFNVITVAAEKKLIRARNGLQVMPDHAFTACPPAEILLVPGGAGTRALLREPSALKWVEAMALKAEIVASICTGSLVLGALGLLDGLKVTTHYEAINTLKSIAPKAEVTDKERFLDHGRILTAAGISAGIDLSLHLVSRLHGQDTARRTAAYMEYHWRNDGGRSR